MDMELTKQIIARASTCFFLFPAPFWPRRRANIQNKLQGPPGTTQAVMNLQEGREHRSCVSSVE